MFPFTGKANIDYRFRGDIGKVATGPSAWHKRVPGAYQKLIEKKTVKSQKISGRGCGSSYSNIYVTKGEDKIKKMK